MDDGAEPSRARRISSGAAIPAEPVATEAAIDAEGDVEAAARVQRSKERRMDAKKKRVMFLDNLLRELDSLVFVELITIYYLDCSFFWFAIRALVHLSMLTPLPDLQLGRQPEEHKAFLPVILLVFTGNFLLHLLFSAPSAGEESRGYLHGGLMIDFIGQQGPTSKWKLAALDVCILILQLVMASVTVKKRELKKKMGNTSVGSGMGSSIRNETENAEGQVNENRPGTHREQDADAEERGILRRTDTLSDIDNDQPEEEETLLSTACTSHPADALDTLYSGHCLIGEFSIIDTMLQEHADYQVYRQTRSETASSARLSPNALRQLHNIRATFGVGGG
ncbi:DUF1746-domain-containing protein [Westerdykella ornata]|uniref:DUF1746-domain-containing protein n=1 Tax=Westerdykella ornata TaxID=318751 RepID=A0A6A6JT25_WESOR|nr:DUF1746-domain-containing protein [Westerdykella ornata]KAF2279394.1 DUF1746-domain-containing protein [Westerdykella ornata]